MASDLDREMVGRGMLGRVLRQSTAAVLAACVIQCLGALAQEPQHLVELMGAQFVDGSSECGLFSELAGGVVFRSNLPTGLWFSDGTPDGTRPLLDGAGGTEYRVAIVRDDTLFTLARTDYPGWTLVRSDGTAQGSYALNQFPLVGLQSNVQDLNPFTELDGWFYFLSADGAQLWRTDLVSETAELMATIGDGQATPNAYSKPTALGQSIVWFTGEQDSAIEVWRFDLQSANLEPVAAIPGPGLSVHGIGDVVSPVVLGESIIFLIESFREDPVFGSLSLRTLWRFDGVELSALAEFSVPDVGAAAHSLTAFADGVAFAASDDLHGEELWWTDGTALGTRRLTEIGAGAASAYPQGLLLRDDRLLFFAEDEIGVALWSMTTDREAAELVVRLWPRNFSRNRFPPAWKPSTGGLGILLFADRVDAPEPNRGLWTSDGSVSGTQPVDLNAWGRYPVQVGQMTFFSGLTIHGEEPSVSSAGESSVLLNLNQSPVEPFGVPIGSGAAAIGDQVVYLDRDNGGDSYVGRSLGSSETTEVVAELEERAFPQNPFFSSEPQFVQVAGRILMVNRDDLFGIRLLRLDDLSRPLIRAAGRFSQMRVLAHDQNRAFVAVIDEDGGFNLYVSDGLTAQCIDSRSFSPLTEYLFPRMLSGDLYMVIGLNGLYDLYVAEGSGSRAGPLLPIMDQGSEFSRPVDAWTFTGLYHVHTLQQTDPLGPSPQTLHRFWRSDGTRSGSFAIAESDSGMVRLGCSDGLEYFSIERQGRAYLARSDGRLDGTQLLAEDPRLLEAQVWVREPGRVIFASVDGGQRGIWSTDFVESQTWMRFPGPARDWQLRPIGFDGTRAYFERAGEIWVATADGASRLDSRIHLEEGDADLFLDGFPAAEFGGRFFFYARDDEGPKLWSTRGTPESTGVVVGENRPLPDPRLLTGALNHLFIATVQDGVTSLWSICRPPDVRIDGPERLAIDDEGWAHVVDVGEGDAIDWRIENGTLTSDPRMGLVHFLASGDADVILTATLAVPGGCQASMVQRVQVIDPIDVTRWLPHLTRRGHGFDTDLVFHHDRAEPVQVQLQPYDEQGVPFQPQTLTVPPFGFLRRSAVSLFGDRNVSHVGLEAADDVTLTASYATTRGSGATAEVHATSLISDRWRFYSGDWGLVFDGAALINPGGVETHIRLRQLGSDGELLRQREIDPIPAWGKRRIVLGDVLDNHPGSLIEIESDQPIAAVFLRGDSGDATALWAILPF